MIPKFRAWDKHVKKIRKVTEIHFDDSLIYLKANNGKGYYCSFSDIVLMQSTSLKDKNGVEIFEGDVVKISDGSNEEDSYTSVVKNYADEGYPAFDIEAPSSWYYESNILATIMGGEYETIEVIGNVWEDGDLINDSEGAEEN